MKEHDYRDELTLNKYLIEHLEYCYGIDFKDTDSHSIKSYLEEVYIIKAISDSEFAEKYMYKFYKNIFDDMPLELSSSIDFDVVFEKLQVILTVTKDEDEKVYYYSNN